MTRDSRKLYVTRFLAFTRPGGKQGDDTGRQGLVCRLTINTRSARIRDYRPVQAIALAPQVTGFTVDSNGDGTPDPTSAFPNQLQSIVIRGNRAYLPNIAASPDGPLRFNVDTHAFVNVIDGVNGVRQTDASAAKFLNLHLGARNPEAGKKRLFFANAWAIAFTNGGGAGAAYVVSAGSDLLVKVDRRPRRQARLHRRRRTRRATSTSTTRPTPATAGANAGKNPQGIVINRAGKRAYVQNFVSRNVSVRRPDHRQGHQGDRHRAGAGARLAGGAGRRRRRDVLLLARPLHARRRPAAASACRAKAGRAARAATSRA